MTPEQLIAAIKQSPGYRGQIIDEQVIEAAGPRFGRLKTPLSPRLARALEDQGIERLYSHQAAAVEAARRGESIVVETGTASGKSLCYNLPVLETIETDRRAKALYLHPTKALAQDQLRALKGFRLDSVVAATYDGDTPVSERAFIRGNANIVLSNFDMVHRGILPHHRRWGDFLMNLRFVVIDEMHTLRGVFGSNCANVLRRLRRILDRYLSKTQVIFTSATIGNPKELAEALLGEQVSVVSGDGSPSSRKTFVFWNPPFLDERAQVRKSSNSEATRLFQTLVEKDIKNIVFSKSRQTAELIHRYAVEKPGRRDGRNGRPAGEIGTKVAPYRAGYLPEERRELEKRFARGELTGLSSTNALELGLDIGGLDACVINGFPGTVSSFFQQAGRCGRSASEATVFFVGGGDPLDQHYLRHPGDLFGRPHEEGLIDPENRSILAAHLICAAYELPLTKADAKYFGRRFDQVLRELEDGGRLQERGERWFFRPQPEDRFPAADVNIRSASHRLYSIIEAESGALLGTIDSGTAFFYVHPGAVYLQQGRSYFVTELDFKRRVALVKPADLSYFTQPRDLTDIAVLNVKEKKRLGPADAFYGDVEVTTEVIGYQKKRVLTGEVIGEEALDLPPQRFRTEALWFLVPPSVVDELELDERQLAGGIHAAEHAAIALLPFYAMCDRRDIGGVSTPAHADTGAATVFVYDGYPGGVGIAKRGFALLNEYLEKTARLVQECGCDDGCPACVVSPKCGNFNEPLDKEAAVRILNTLVGKRSGTLRKGSRAAEDSRGRR